jgi:tRNA (cytidine32/uridine32-2'-O)-methyltransferase
MYFENISVLLVGTTHSGNVGAAARAMKTMGLSHLGLVAPACSIDEQAIALATGAADVLQQAQIYPDLNQALTDQHFVVGTSARARHIEWPVVSPREAAQSIVTQAQAGAKISILFGRERDGLSNPELARCHLHVQIPTAEYSSLNLASAVQILCYEIRLALLELEAQPKIDPPKNPLTELAPAQEMELFLEHLKSTLIQTGFLKPGNQRKLMLRIRRLFMKIPLEQREVNILRGIITSFIDPH